MGIKFGYNRYLEIKRREHIFMSTVELQRFRSTSKVAGFESRPSPTSTPGNLFTNSREKYSRARICSKLLRCLGYETTLDLQAFCSSELRSTVDSVRKSSILLVYHGKYSQIDGRLYSQTSTTEQCCRFVSHGQALVQ